MKYNSRPPRALSSILKSIAPKFMHEELLGDMEERFHQTSRRDQHRASWKYCIECLRVMPFLLMTRFRTADFRKAAAQLPIILALVLVIVAWEASIVNKHAWPMTASLSEAAPVSAIILFFSIYSLLYLFGTFLIFGFYLLVIQTFRSTDRLPVSANPILLAVVLSATLIFSMLNPEPLDSLWMRIFLLVLVWGMAFGTRCIVKQFSRSTNG